MTINDQKYRANLIYVSLSSMIAINERPASQCPMTITTTIRTLNINNEMYLFMSIERKYFRLVYVDTHTEIMYFGNSLKSKSNKNDEVWILR